MKFSRRLRQRAGGSGTGQDKPPVSGGLPVFEKQIYLTSIGASLGSFPFVGVGVGAIHRQTVCPSGISGPHHPAALSSFS